MEFITNAPPYLQTLWYIAIISALVFIIQTIMTFAGADADAGSHADFNGNLYDGDTPFQLYSFRNLINFLLGFSWTGISFYGIISNKILLTVVAFAIGALFVLIFFFIINQLLKLSEDNTFKIQYVNGKNAEVYLSIPASNTGKGKIHVSYNGAVREIDAITLGTEKIESGSIVRIIKIENNIVIVEKISL